MSDNNSDSKQEILFTEFVQPQEPTLFPLSPIEETRSAAAGQELSQVVRRVFIYANPSKSDTDNCLKELVHILKEMRIEALVYNESHPSRVHLIRHVAQALNISVPTKSLEYYGEHPEEPFVEFNGLEVFDLVITVGGDGTVLKYLSYSPFRGVPILPINTGSLGYITSISFHNMTESMKTIFSGAFVFSSRLMLKAQLLDRYQNPKHYRDHFALNEIAVSTGRAGLLADMELQVGTSSIPLQGDGVIVATPTGSTAYSLAAGGPIVDSEMEALIITPVSPFSLATRPVVTPSNVHLFIRNSAIPHNNIPAGQTPGLQRAEAEQKRTKELCELDSSEVPLPVAIDGWALGQLYPGESIHITGGQERIQFLAMSHDNSYFENIRTKLGWHNVAHRQSHKAPPK